MNATVALRVYTIAIVCCGGISCKTAEPVASRSLQPNLDVMRSLAMDIGREIGSHVRRKGGDQTVVLTVRPVESSWLVDAALIAGISEEGCSVRWGGGGRFALHIGIEQLGVQYSNSRREGFFGQHVVDRTVTVACATHVTDVSDGTILVSETIRRDHTDTVPTDAINQMENQTIAATRGTLPAEGFLSSVVEPVIVLAAIGVAVFLLFHVRS